MSFDQLLPPPQNTNAGTISNVLVVVFPTNIRCTEGRTDCPRTGIVAVQTTTLHSWWGTDLLHHVEGNALHSHGACMQVLGHTLIQPHHQLHVGSRALLHSCTTFA